MTKDRAAMATLRTFAEDDIPAAAALFGRVYPKQRWTSQAACEAYFREILFNNPWRDLDLPSWVAEEDGRMAGFAGVMPRRMLFRGRRFPGHRTCSSPMERTSCPARCGPGSVGRHRCSTTFTGPARSGRCGLR